MENLFLRVLTLSLTASLVLLPLLALAPRLHHRYAGRTSYVLWLVLAVRLVLPVPLTLPNPAVTVDLPPARTVTLSGAVQAPAAVKAPAGAEAADAPAAVEPAQPVPAEMPRRPGVGWTQLGAWLWLGGMASLLVYQGAGYALARRKLLRGAEPGSEEETALLAAWPPGWGCGGRRPCSARWTRPPPWCWGWPGRCFCCRRGSCRRRRWRWCSAMSSPT